MALALDRNSFGCFNVLCLLLGAIVKLSNATGGVSGQSLMTSHRSGDFLTPPRALPSLSHLIASFIESQKYEPPMKRDVIFEQHFRFPFHLGQGPNTENKRTKSSLFGKADF